MHELNDDHLIDAYIQAVQANLNGEFIQLLKLELTRRNLSIPDVPEQTSHSIKQNQRHTKDSPD
jgi:hypothetical protein